MWEEIIVYMFAHCQHTQQIFLESPFIPGTNLVLILFSKNFHGRADGVAQVVKRQPSKYKALSSNLTKKIFLMPKLLSSQILLHC
jgi:hypothetical protein